MLKCDIFQLLDTKSTDRKTTLLHYIVMTVQDKFKDVSNFDAELRYIEKAATGGSTFAIVFRYEYEISGPN